MQALENLILYLMKMAVNFRRLQISKILNTDANRIFPVIFKYAFLDKPVVIYLGLPMGKSKFFLKKCFCFFLN